MSKTLMREIVLHHWLTPDGKVDLGSKTLLVSIWQAPMKPAVGTTIAEIREVSPLLVALEHTEAAPLPVLGVDEEDKPKVEQVGEKLPDGVLMTTGGSMQITEGQWVNLKKRIESFPFQFNIALILKFADDIEAAKIVEMVKAPAQSPD
jgi:hypothetical protein